MHDRQICRASKGLSAELYAIPVVSVESTKLISSASVGCHHLMKLGNCRLTRLQAPCPMISRSRVARNPLSADKPRTQQISNAISHFISANALRHCTHPWQRASAARARSHVTLSASGAGRKQPPRLSQLCRDIQHGYFEVCDPCNHSCCEQYVCASTLQHLWLRSLWLERTVWCLHGSWPSFDQLSRSRDRVDCPPFDSGRICLVHSYACKTMGGPQQQL